MASPRLQTGRCSQIGAYYAITSITGKRQPAFREPAPAELLIAEIQRCVFDDAFEPLAWVVMPDHFHLLLQLKH